MLDFRLLQHGVIPGSSQTRARAVEQQVRELDRRITKLARRDGQVRRFMTVPGVGPVTALAFKATIDESGTVCAIERRRCLCRVDQ